MAPVVLTQRQTEVFDALQSRSANLAGAYKSAVVALGTPAESGLESSRVAIIAHCIRELMNGLPGALVETFIPRVTPNAESRKSAMIRQFDKNPVDLDADLDEVRIPIQLAKAVSALIVTTRQEESRNQRNASELLTDGSDPKHPAIRQWKTTQKFFLHWTHFDRNQNDPRPLPTDDEITSHIQVVEDAVLGRTAAFFDALHTVEDILAFANARSTGSSA